MTLLDSKATLSSFAKINISNFIKNGIKFTIASARSVKSIQPIFRDVALELPIIEFNGAFISELKTGNHHVINAIEQTALNKVRDILSNSNTNYFLSTFNGYDDKLHYAATRNEGEKWYVGNRLKNDDPRLNKTKNIDIHFDEDVVCITIIDTEENLRRVLDELYLDNKRIKIHLQENLYSPGWFWLTIHSHHATKDQAIDCLLRHCDMVGSSVTAFGDNTNDIGMLKYASRAIAVKNACSELKGIADIIIGKNDDDSVVKYIAEENRLELLGEKN